MDETPSHAPEPQPMTGSKSISPLFVAFCFIAAIVFFNIPSSMEDPDLWWHLRDAQLQLSNHAFLSHDLYSYTAAGSTWMNHEWLAELPFYAGFRLFGFSGVYAVTLLTIEAIFLGLFYLIYSESKSITGALFGTIFAVLLSTVSFGPRTLLYGWLLLVVELLILARSMRREQAIWAMPFLFAVWVNTHGSWMIGIVIFGLFVASNFFTVSNGAIENQAASKPHIKRLLIAWCASAAALFLNPYGWRLVFYPFDMAFKQPLNIANIEEWHSLDFHTPRGRIMFLCLGLLFLLQLVRNRKWTLFELAVTAVGLYSAFSYSRFLFLAGILVGPVLARSLLSRSTTPRKPVSPLIAAAALFMIFGVVVGRVRTLDRTASDNDDRFPTKMLPYLSTFHPDGNIFNEYIWGGFLIWHEHQIPIFVDSRVDIFEYNGTFKDYLDIVHLNNDPIALLNKHKIKYVLFEKGAPLTYLLKTTHDWKVDYEDKTVTLLERKNPPQ
jgi:hypothetical protein